MPGATSIAELAVMGKPALLIPYSLAADDHQRANAEALARSGGAWVCLQSDFKVHWLKDFLNGLLADRMQLARLGRENHQMAKPEAARHIVSALQILGEGPMVERAS